VSFLVFPKQPLVILSVVLFVAAPRLAAAATPATPAPAAAPAATPTTPTFCPQGTARLTGTVRDADGRLVAGARVLYAGDGWDENCVHQARIEVTATTDTQGVYDMKIPWGSGKVQFFHPDPKAYPGYDVESLRSAGDRFHRDHRFTRIWVHVDVAAPDSGHFVLGLVHCTPPSPSDGHEMIASLLAGSVDFYVRHPGRYRFRVEPALEYEEAPIAPVEVTVSRDTTISMRVNGYRVSGVVKRDESDPLGEARVTAYGPAGMGRATSDSDGTFSMLLPPGKYSWLVEPAERDIQIWRDFDPTNVRGPERVSLMLNPVLLSGRVLERSVDGAPADSIHVTLSERGVAEPVADSVTARDGKFHFYVRKGARFRLSLEDERPRAVLRRTATEGWGLDVAMEKAKQFESAELPEFPVTRDSTVDLYVKRIAH